MNLAFRDASPGDGYVPAFEVRIEKDCLRREVVADVLSVSYQDHLDEIDGFQLTVNNAWDIDARRFRYSDSDIFLPGKRLELSLGYRGGAGLTRMVRGVITGLSVSFPADGAPVLNVTGQNVLHTLRRERSSVSYAKRRDSDVAQEIAARLQVDLVVESGPRFVESELTRLVQANEYDIVFLLRRARRLGYELIVDEGSEGGPFLRLLPSADRRTEPRVLSYIGDKQSRLLLEFNATFSTAKQAASVRSDGWDHERQEAISVEVRRDEVAIRDPDLDATVISAAIEGRVEVIADRPFQDQTEAESHARQMMTRIKQTLIEATGRTVGLPDLRAGSVVRIAGVGDRYSGRYLITGTEHQMGGAGYTTGFSCRREEV